MSGEIGTALPFIVMAVFFDLLFAGIAVAQARAQGNENWWIWGWMVLGAPFLGYFIWRLFGATDDGSPSELFPRR